MSEGVVEMQRTGGRRIGSMKGMQGVRVKERERERRGRGLERASSRAR